MANSATRLRPTAKQKTYVLVLRATPGRDDIRSLRALLKTAGRYYGLRALSVRELPSSLRNTRPARAKRLASKVMSASLASRRR
jgi:hypothetical protein